MSSNAEISWSYKKFYNFYFQNNFIYFSCQLKIGTCQEYLLVTEQQGCLPSACAAAAADFWHFLKGIQDEEWGTVCSRESGGTCL